MSATNPRQLDAPCCRHCRFWRATRRDWCSVVPAARALYGSEPGDYRVWQRMGVTTVKSATTTTYVCDYWEPAHATDTP